ncbi:MAG: hypothetical protein LBG84_10355 [Treponema sp.]|jgi:hypothetical protein|nr:hypothetical protein [Treponema sp.]
MKKKFFLIVLLIGWGGLVFGQMGIDLGLGFQYGKAWVTDRGQTLRNITEPGVLISFRFVPNTIGGFARLGLLFPSEVTEGDLTLNYSEYDYIVFINGALGPSFRVPLNDRFSLMIDAGISINDLLYGGSYKADIDATWEVKIENLGGKYTQRGGTNYQNIKMKEVYNDVGIGLLGNVAMRFFFTQNVFMELGMAASFDFLRFKYYKFYADFSAYPHSGQPGDWYDDFPAGKVSDDKTELILESDSKFTIFKQFTFIPSLTVGFRF